MNTPKLTGAELIAQERQRQIDVECYEPSDDDEHTRGELASAASAYVLGARDQVLGIKTEGIRQAIGMMYWPHDWGKFKLTDDPVRNLVKAGALIAAEIDRLQRADSTARHREALRIAYPNLHQKK